MKTLNLDELEKISGGGFWTNLGNGFCAGYGAIRLFTSLIPHPGVALADKVIGIGCAALALSQL